MSALTSLVGEGRYLDNEIIRQAVPTAIWETLAMTGVASALTALIGIPLGVLLGMVWGHLALALGLGLSAAGLLWTRRLVRGAEEAAP